MPKILVLYHSNSGNTRQMAQLVAEGAGQLDAADVRLKDITSADHTDLEWCDGIALGSPTNYGSVCWQMKQWWDEQPIENWGKRDGRIGCVFTSAGAWGGGQEWTCMTLLSILINYGFLVFGLTDYTGVKFSAHYGAISAGAPLDDHVKEACRRLGLRLTTWAFSFLRQFWHRVMTGGDSRSLSRGRRAPHREHDGIATSAATTQGAVVDEMAAAARSI